MSTAATRSALRHLLRATNTAFRNDAGMLSAARQTICDKVRSANTTDTPTGVQEMQEATTFLQNNIIQSPLNTRGNYVVQAKIEDK